MPSVFGFFVRLAVGLVTARLVIHYLGGGSQGLLVGLTLLFTALAYVLAYFYRIPRA
jgi:succinate-acetate transporter protein